MSKFDLVMPKLGESVLEATITKWFVKEGDTIEEDAPVLEVATDKVDSEIPSPVAGKVVKVFYNENDVVPVGKIIAVISLDGSEYAENKDSETTTTETKSTESATKKTTEKTETQTATRFYSPLVKNIAAQENVSVAELEKITGSGLNNRVTKNDLISYLNTKEQESTSQTEPQKDTFTQTEKPQYKVNVSVSAGDEIFEMDRMRRLIADHMVMSKQVAPHVTSMVEADVTNIVLWRNRIKDKFEQREKEKLTFLPIFLEAIAKALKEYPRVNSLVDGYTIIERKNINLGIAVALPSGNLIVPVIKNTDYLNLTGITKELNRLANAARDNKLKPDEIEGGTFSITNFGTFKNVMGTPIINQPQVAIMAIGTIEKKPAVVETPTGDIIAIRHKMFLSLTYNHRVVDGALGGAFLRRVADIIEAFDSNREI